MGGWKLVFVPFLGDFFSMISKMAEIGKVTGEFSSPFSGTFFQ